MIDRRKMEILWMALMIVIVISAITLHEPWLIAMQAAIGGASFGYHAAMFKIGGEK